MGRRLALVIGNSLYRDEKLARLVSPEADVGALADALLNENIGGFDDVKLLVNMSSDAIRKGISTFFSKKSRDDLLLFYFSGHGVLDERGRLYLALKDTDTSLLRATAIPASFITDEVDNSRSRRQVLILDCCHSGAFSRGSKGALGASVGTASAFEGSGFGRVILTASDATQYAWEGNQIIGEAENSLFTHFLVQGIQTGEADSNRNGMITIDELYDYAYTHILNETPKQTPGKWSFKEQGELIIARSSATGPFEDSQPKSRIGSTKTEPAMPKSMEIAESQQPEEKKPGWQRLAWWFWATIGVFVIGTLAVTFSLGENGILGIASNKTTPTATNNILQPTDTIEIGIATQTETETVGEPTKTETPVLPTATPASKINPVDGAVAVYIPSGEFLMGSEEGNVVEIPVHSVYLDSFWMYQYEVTNSQFAEFLNAMGNQTEGRETWLGVGGDDEQIQDVAGTWQVIEGYAEHPAIDMTWHGADSYCEWAGGRLPTEAEWEKAARGGLEGKLYPWGDEVPNCEPGSRLGAQFSICNEGTVPVGSFAPNGYGLYDMAGNVMEWTADWYGDEYYQNSEFENPQGPESGLWRVIRGGSERQIAHYLTVFRRENEAQRNNRIWLGFRCVLPDN